jgi:hypothetical protein
MFWTCRYVFVVGYGCVLSSLGCWKVLGITYGLMDVEFMLTKAVLVLGTLFGCGWDNSTSCAFSSGTVEKQVRLRK